MKLFRKQESYISEQIKIHGDIYAADDLTIAGEVLGNIYAQKCVMLGSKANFEGDIECDTALICGHLKGSVRAKRTLEVKAPAAIIGELTAESVRVDSGVAIQGNVHAKSVERLAPVTELFIPPTDEHPAGEGPDRE